jgi:hypothetical protein
MALCLAGVATAQRPEDPTGGGQPQPLRRPAAQHPQVPQGTATVVPDTVEIAITFADSVPVPRFVRVVQDTLEFGGLLHLVLDYPPDQRDGPHLQPQAEGDWLVAESPPRPGFVARLLARVPGRSPAPPVDLSVLPASDDLRVVRSFRVYRRDPLQIRWDRQLSPVLVVRGQTGDGSQTATIRQPRSLVWRPWQLLLLGLVVLLIAAWLVRWWRQRQHLVALEHWSVPAPAWMATAQGLQALLADNILARGETRRFLDRLAFLARDYVAQRYRVAAREQTGREIIRACAALGHDPAHPAGFAQLIDLADRRRYDPQAPEAAFCREQAVQFLGRIARVRLERHYVSVAPDQQLAADKAWSALADELGVGAGRAVRTPANQEVR